MEREFTDAREVTEHGNALRAVLARIGIAVVANDVTARARPAVGAIASELVVSVDAGGAVSARVAQAVVDVDLDKEPHHIYYVYRNMHKQRQHTKYTGISCRESPSLYQ